ncbi:MAG: hypothetical protein IH849_04930 [Acidobacteria bacterium]|nr:hypothetical protein [Acidobacteriota bacterium]
MHFEIVGKIDEVQLIAQGPSVRERSRLPRQFGRARWRKLKGMATLPLASGVLRRAELHWYEAHGIGRRKLEIMSSAGTCG